MASEQQPLGFFRMPDRLFAELASGGGSLEAVAFLERGERARRLLLLRTLLDRLYALSTPLTPAADAWRTLQEAATRAPEPVDRILRAPSTGGWIAHMLRRVHATADGPPLWAEAGHLCALAIAACLHTDAEADLLVPLTDGTLSLPGWGMARLPGGARGLTTGRARTSQGQLTLTGPGPGGRQTSLTCRPAASRGSDSPLDPHWLPLRFLAYSGRTGMGVIPLDDLDPYRDIEGPVRPSRLDADEAVAWQQQFDEALAILAEPGGTGPGRLDPAMIRAVVPWGRTSLIPPPTPDVRVSASSGDSFGSMTVSRPGSALALAETLVHEFQHSKLAALLHLFPLLEDDRSERFYAPWRSDPRHLTGLLHGAYAFTGVAGFWRDRLAGARDACSAETAGYHLALRRTQTRLVVRTLLTSGSLTSPGRALVAGLAHTLDGWLREPVPGAALRRARTAAALHRTEWRLRNVAPPALSRPDPQDGAPRFQADRAGWPDVRTLAFAACPAAPRTADEHLAAGDPSTALTLYADALTADPAEPHALAGWIVARAALAPGRAARRMLARPELLLEAGGSPVDVAPSRRA